MTAAQHAGQETARAQAAARAAQDETERVRADAGKMLDQARAEAARERDELRTRAERAERQQTPTATNSASSAPPAQEMAPTTAAVQSPSRPRGAQLGPRPPERPGAQAIGPSAVRLAA